MSPRLDARAVACAALLVPLLAPRDAGACGGCFHEELPPDPPASAITVVTGHRMALSISTKQTVLWDQIRYSGEPGSFAWVLPIKPGATLELSNDSWFEALDAATTADVIAPVITCATPDDSSYAPSPSCGCRSESGSGSGGAGGAGVGGAGGGGDEPPPVSVVHEGTVGPYETVTLHANVPDALPSWLASHGFAIEPSEQPIIDAYTDEGFDFIALRLLPGKGVRQMKPVRVISPGASPALPLRMVAVGTGAHVDVTLFVIGEGRWEAQNFPNGTVDQRSLTWDFVTSSSNYAKLRKKALAAHDGRTWLTTFAVQGAMLSGITNGITGLQTYTASNGFDASSLAQLYVEQARSDGELTGYGCSFDDYAGSGDLVLPPCDPAGGATCPTPKIGQLDGLDLTCGTLDDMGVALTGMHPRDVWLTRLEASLPYAALVDDLTLQAEPTQATLGNFLQAAKFVNPPCIPASAGTLAAGGGGSRRRAEAVFLAWSLAVLAAAVARRALRPRPVARPA